MSCIHGGVWLGLCLQSLCYSLCRSSAISLPDSRILRQKCTHVCFRLMAAEWAIVVHTLACMNLYVWTGWKAAVNRMTTCAGAFMSFSHVPACNAMHEVINAFYNNVCRWLHMFCVCDPEYVGVSHPADYEHDYGCAYERYGGRERGFARPSGGKPQHKHLVCHRCGEQGHINRSDVLCHFFCGTPSIKSTSCSCRALVLAPGTAQCVNIKGLAALSNNKEI